MTFAHLHVHTEYSMLDGAARVDELMRKVAEEGMPGVAITDHGNTFGAFDFWKAAQKYGVKAIIGLEAYMTPGTPRSDRSRVLWGSGGQDDVSGGGAYTHITLLAYNNKGLSNLFILSSLASLEGYYFKPRLDMELLESYSAGLIATTSCPSGEVQTRIRLGQIQEARKVAGRMRDIFGAENYFCEVMSHGLDIERRAMPELLALAKELDLPLLATNDLHYTEAEDASSHAALLCVQSGSTMLDPNRFRFDSDEFYLKSAKQMRKLFADLPGACDNTLLVAERCNTSFDVGHSYMPHFPVPEGETENSWFTKEVERGIKKRYGLEIADAVARRAEYETRVIVQMGFAGYFLIVADFVNWAKSNGIRVGPGRGSGAGSIVAYAMRITDLDPLEHRLLFERFLNPDRVSMPDFDIDFDERRRGEVINYVTEKYGSDHVAQIVTYGTIKAKQALKDSTRVLGYPYSLGERLTKAMPPAIMGRDVSLSAIFDPSNSRYREASEVRALIQEDPEAKKVFDAALGLENLKRQWGVHAAGVIMSSKPLMSIIPIMKREVDGQIVTQFDYPACEALGLVKMDFLGLRNLTILEDALVNVQKNRGICVDLEALGLDDPEVYSLLGRGDTLGVFQLDSDPIRQLLETMQPDSFEDIAATIALYRPGPMGAKSHTNYALRKNGRQSIDYIHPELKEALEPILAPTYGLVVYQEQVMEIAQKLAGFSLGQADLLRRAMGKKKKVELDRQFDAFSSGMLERGFARSAIDRLWEVLVPFSDYAFAKAHAAAYGLLSYWTAYLKARYPVEYMAALLTSVGDSRDRLSLYLHECRRMGIRVFPPDINASMESFTPAGQDIRFGLGAVRNIGHTVIKEVLQIRQAEGPFKSLEDYLKRLSATGSNLNRRSVASLIKAGAFDGIYPNRRALFEIHEVAIETIQKERKEESKGAIGLDFGSLFDEESTPGQRFCPAEVSDWPSRARLNFEREMLGMYVSSHPLVGLERLLSRESDARILDVLEGKYSDRDRVVLAGILTSSEHKVARKSGQPYGQLVLEDISGEMTVMVMGKVYQEYSALLVTDTVESITGQVFLKDEGQPVLHAQQLVALDVKDFDPQEDLELQCSDSLLTASRLEELTRILTDHPGPQAVILHLLQGGRRKVFELPQKVKVDRDLIAAIKGVLGGDCLFSPR